MASTGAVLRAVRAGDPVRVLPNLYASALHAESFAVRVMATQLWAPAGSAIGGRAALFLQGATDKAPDTIDVVVPYGRHRAGAPWIRLHAPRSPMPHQILGGVAVSLPEFALIRAFVVAPRHEEAELVYRAIRSGVVRLPELVDAMDGVARIPGRRRLARLVLRAELGDESYLEQRASTTVFTGGAFADLLRQHRIVVEGEAFRLDYFDPQSRVAIEVDGMASHANVLGKARDSRRDALLATVGILTLRFTYSDVMNRPGWCRRVALDVMAGRRQRAA